MRDLLSELISHSITLQIRKNGYSTSSVYNSPLTTCGPQHMIDGGAMSSRIFVDQKNYNYSIFFIVNCFLM